MFSVICHWPIRKVMDLCTRDCRALINNEDLSMELPMGLSGIHWLVECKISTMFGTVAWKLHWNSLAANIHQRKIFLTTGRRIESWVLHCTIFKISVVDMWFNYLIIIFYFQSLLKFLAEAHRGVHGFVIDENGNPVERASVKVKSRDISFLTTKYGEFWRVLLPGLYKLEVTNITFLMTWNVIKLISTSRNYLFFYFFFAPHFQVYANGYAPREVEFMVVEQHPTQLNVTLYATKVRQWSFLQIKKVYNNDWGKFNWWKC